MIGKTIFSIGVLVLSILVSCKEQNTRPTNILFCPNPNVTLDALMKDRYEVIPETVTALTKEIKDTLYVYQFGNLEERPLYYSFKVRFNEINENHFSEFLNEYGLRLLCHDDSVKEGYHNIMQHRETSLVYKISIEYDESSNVYYLWGTTDFPWNNKIRVDNIGCKK